MMLRELGYQASGDVHCAGIVVN